VSYPNFTMTADRKKERVYVEVPADRHARREFTRGSAHPERGSYWGSLHDPRNGRKDRDQSRMHLTEAMAAPAMPGKNDAISGRSSGRCFDDHRRSRGRWTSTPCRQQQRMKPRGHRRTVRESLHKVGDVARGNESTSHPERSVAGHRSPPGLSTG